MKFCLRCLWFLWVFFSGSWSFLSVRRKTLEFPQVRLVHFYKLEPDFCPCVVFDTFTLGKNGCFMFSGEYRVDEGSVISRFNTDVSPEPGEARRTRTSFKLLCVSLCPNQRPVDSSELMSSVLDP